MRLSADDSRIPLPNPSPAEASRLGLNTYNGKQLVENVLEPSSVRIFARQDGFSLGAKTNLANYCIHTQNVQTEDRFAIDSRMQPEPTSHVNSRRRVDGDHADRPGDVSLGWPSVIDAG